MSQQLSITIDGKESHILPDSVGKVLDAVFALLKSLDERSWAVGAPRIQWRLSAARLVNPLTLTATGKELAPANGHPDVAMLLIEHLKQIEHGQRPAGFTVKELKLARLIGKEAKRSRALTLTGESDGRATTIEISHRFLSRVQSLLRRPTVTRKEYAALEGTLVRVSNDPLRNDASATLRERLSNQDVACHSPPTIAKGMAMYLDRSTRVVVYGTVTYEDDLAVSIEVEDFISIPDVLPTLDDLHSRQLQVPGGSTVEEYLDDLRGDE